MKNNNNVPIDKRSLDEIYEAAKKESGPLVVAAGGDAQAQWDGIRSAFTKRFPDIKLELTVNFSKYHDSIIDRKFYEGENYCDIAWLQTLQDFPRWRDQDRLLYYKPPNFHKIYASHRDLNGAFLGVFLFSFGRFLYDNTQLSEDELPKTYLDLLDPKWKGKLVLAKPNDDDAVGFLFSIIIDRYGFDWLEALNKQDVQWVRGTATPSYIIAEQHEPELQKTRPPEFKSDNGHRVLTFTTAGHPLNHKTLSWKDVSAPEHYMTWPQTACIFKTTPRPESCKLLLAYFTSDEFQSMLASQGPTVMKHMDKKTGHRMNESEVTDDTGFKLHMADRFKCDWWRMQFETTLGTPQGPSPMTVYTFDDIRAL